MKQTKKQQLESINTILAFNANLIEKGDYAHMALSNENKVFAVISGKTNEDDFIPAIIKAINEEKDCTCEIISATSFNYGYDIDFGVEILQDGDKYKDTFTGTFVVLY